MKHVLKNMLALFVGSLIALVLVEVMSRVWVPQLPTAEWFVASERYHHGLKPDFHQRYAYTGHDFVMDVQTNSQGFRDVEHDFDAPYDGETVLLLGDSFVFGYGVTIEERFDTHVRAALGDAPIRVVNTGVPGWGTTHETAFARDHFKAIAPDCIVLVYCANDPANDRGEELPVLSDSTGLTGALKQWLRGNVHSYRFVMRQWALWRNPGLTSARETSHTGDSPMVADLREGSAQKGGEWDATRAVLQQFAKDFLEFNPEGVLVIMAAAPDDPVTRNQLGSLDDGGRIRYLDFSEAFVAVPEQERTTAWDGHWSPRIHQVVGVQLGAFLRAVREELAQSEAKGAVNAPA